MEKYDFCPGPKGTRAWLRKQIGGHFDDRARSAAGSMRNNNNLSIILRESVILPVFEGEEQINLKINSRSEFVAFRASESMHGKIAAIFDVSGVQYTFLGDSNRLVCRSEYDLQHGRRDVLDIVRRPYLSLAE